MTQIKLNRRSKLCFATAICVSCSFAVTSTIGVAASGSGTFTLNDAKVQGNVNVFEGSQIKTAAAPSRVYLQQGVVLTLGTNSTGTFYKDHLLLQKGATRVGSMNQYLIDVARYRIQSAQPTSEAVVRLDGSEVQIAALSGAVNVFNQQGALLTRIGAGTASAFQTSDKPASAAQSGANSGQTGATPATTEEEKRKKRRREAALYLTLGTTLAGLGLAVDAILQPGSGGPGPTSP
jgi:hypothetical protein